MAIVRSFGALQSMGTQTPNWTTSGSITLNQASSFTYAKLYSTQPNVRTVVDFLARNIAQLGLHVFRRVSDTDRERLSGHDLSAWLKTPNPSTTRYRLIESLMADLGIYFEAYWLKVRTDDQLGLVRLPPSEMSVAGTLQPTKFTWSPMSGAPKEFAPSEIVHFSGYNPDNALMGLSPLETLRKVLAEEHAASTYREAFYNNSARIDGIISRPKDAGTKWTANQVTEFREMWQSAHAGGLNAGKVAVLQDGMTFTPAAHSARDSEFTASRKLGREEVAAAYHVPLPMVGILDHATFSNIKEQHKHLYQDCLGPWLVMIEEEIERQLLPEASDVKGVYVEFNIAEKLKGSFEEQAASLMQLVGRPIMTPNEGRARLNLPSDADPASDQLAMPLNTKAGPQMDVDEPDEDEAPAATWRPRPMALREASRV